MTFPFCLRNKGENEKEIISSLKGYSPTVNNVYLWELRFRCVEWNYLIHFISA